MREEKTVWTCDHCKRVEINEQWATLLDGWFVIDRRLIRAHTGPDAYSPSQLLLACDRVCAQAILRELKAEHDKAFWEHHNSLYPKVVATLEGWVVETSGSDTNAGGLDKPEAAEVQP